MLCRANWLDVFSKLLLKRYYDKLKLGLETNYFSRQQLNSDTFGTILDYRLYGRKAMEKCSLFINFENFTDTRQTKFDTIYSGTINKPVFSDI